MPTENKPESPTGVTDEIIQEEIQAHWAARAMRPVRRAYEWMLHWAETPYGSVALGAISYSEAVFFPLPPDPLLVALCLGRPRRSFWYAINCTITNVLGGMTALLLGMWVGQERVLAAMAYLGQEENALKVLKFFGAEQGFWHDFVIIGLAALTPIPFKVFGWVAGFAGCDWLAFLLAQTIFRKIRFIAIGWIIFAYGAAARRFIDKYFNWVFAGVMLLLILIVVGIKGLGQLLGG